MTQNQNLFNKDSFELKDRTLWIDGDVSLNTSTLVKMFLSLDEIDRNKIFVKEIDNDVKRFNQLVDNKLKIKAQIKPINNEFNIPKEYKNLNLKTVLFDKLFEETSNKNFSSDEIEERINRIIVEYKLILELNMEMLFKSIIFLLEQFKNNIIVWGVGRGSSCASYALYLLGLHMVDAVKYKLDQSEFFRLKLNR